MTAFRPDKSLRHHTPVRERKGSVEPVYRFNEKAIPSEVYHRIASLIAEWTLKDSRTAPGEPSAENLLLRQGLDETITFLNSL